MITSGVNQVILRQPRRTTHVRIMPSDAKVLDDITDMLDTLNPGVRYKRSDAINWLIQIADKHYELPIHTPE